MRLQRGASKGVGGSRTSHPLHSPRFGTRMVRSKVMTTVPSALRPVVRTVTIPCVGRLAGLALRQHLGLRVERVADEHRRAQPDVGPAEIADRLLADVADAHADHDREREAAVHQRPAELRLRRIGGIEMQRVGVHGRQVLEPRCVWVSEMVRPGRCSYVVARVEVLVIAAQNSRARAKRADFLCDRHHSHSPRDAPHCLSRRGQAGVGVRAEHRCVELRFAWLITETDRRARCGVDRPVAQDHAARRKDWDRRSASGSVFTRPKQTSSPPGRSSFGERTAGRMLLQKIDNRLLMRSRPAQTKCDGDLARASAFRRLLTNFVSCPASTICRPSRVS